MSGFGQYVAIISDLSEFVRRVEQKVKSDGLVYAAGPVKYHKVRHSGRTAEAYEKHHALIMREDAIPITTIPDLKITKDCFNKNIVYESQKEWRVALYHGSKDIDTYRLEVGDLSDIVIGTDTEHLTACIDQLLRESKIRSCIGYFGDRKKLREELLKAGDNMVHQFMVVG